MTQVTGEGEGIRKQWREVFHGWTGGPVFGSDFSLSCEGGALSLRSLQRWGKDGGTPSRNDVSTRPTTAKTGPPAQKSGPAGRPYVTNATARIPL